MELYDEQLDFKVAYVSALNGTASLDPDISTQSESYDDIFNLIIILTYRYNTSMKRNI